MSSSAVSIPDRISCTIHTNSSGSMRRQESQGILGCGLDCLLAIFRFNLDLPQWANLQQVCKRWAEACRLPAVLSLLDPSINSLILLVKSLHEKVQNVAFYRKMIQFAKTLFVLYPHNNAPAELLDEKIKSITKHALLKGNVECVRMGLEFVSCDSNVDTEPFLFLSLCCKSSECFQLLLESKANLNVQAWDQSIATRLGLGCHWPTYQKKAVFDQLRDQDTLLPELEAATLGDRVWLERLAQQAGSESNKAWLRADAQGFTALHYACSSNQLDVVRWLLSNGFAQVDETSQEGFTGIIRASRNGHSNGHSILRFLLENGALVDKIGHGWLPLTYAARSGNLEEVKLLLEAKADPCQMCEDGLFALLSSVECRHIELCALLIEAKANIEQRQKNNNWTALHRAAYFGYCDVISLLVSKKAAIDSVDLHNRTPLCLAISEDHMDVVVLLIDSHADIHHSINGARTPIQLAICGEEVRMVKYLLQKGADVNTISPGGQSLLHLALESSTTQEPDFRLVETLLEHKASVNDTDPKNSLISMIVIKAAKPVAKMIVDRNLSTDFYLAIIAGNTELVSKALQTKSIPPDRKYGRLSFLDIAALHGHEAILKLLLHSRSYTQTELFESLQHSSFRGCLGTTRLLVEAKAPLQLETAIAFEEDFPILNAAGNGHVDVTEYLLEQKANPNAQLCWTAMMAASWRGQILTLEVLLHAGGSIDSKSSQGVSDQDIPSGVTALWLAVSKNHQGVVHRLLDAKANANETEDEALTSPLHVAAATGRVSIVKLLLQAGASLELINLNGYTSLDLAAKANHKEVISLLSATTTRDLFSCIYLRDINLMQKLIAENENSVHARKRGTSVIYVASKRGLADFVELLLKAKANPRVGSRTGKTPLEASIKQRNIRVVELLNAALG